MVVTVKIQSDGKLSCNAVLTLPQNPIAKIFAYSRNNRFLKDLSSDVPYSQHPVFYNLTVRQEERHPAV